MLTICVITLIIVACLAIDLAVDAIRREGK